MKRRVRRRAHVIAPAGLGLVGALLFAACADAPGSVYFTSGLTDEVVRLDARDGSVVRRVSLDRRRHESDEPHALALAPDGTHWYATVAHGQPSLWKFETGSDRLVGRVDLPSGGAAMIGMSPDGGTAFIPDYDRAGGRTGRVAAVRLDDLNVSGHVPVCAAAHDAAVHPDDDLVAIACAGSGEVVLMRTDLSIVARVAAPAANSYDDMGGHVPAGGSRPLSVAWSPDGELLAVALHSAGQVWLLDRDGTTRGTIASGAGPSQLAFVDDDIVVSANRMDGSLSVIDVRARRELRRIRLPIERPHGVVIGRDGIAYVACEGLARTEGGVVAVDVESGRLLWQRRAGRYVLAVLYVP